MHLIWQQYTKKYGLILVGETFWILYTDPLSFSFLIQKNFGLFASEIFKHQMDLRFDVTGF